MTTKRDRKRELRRQRLEQEEAAQRAEERHKRRVNIAAWLIAGPVIAFLAITLFGKLYSGSGSTDKLSAYYPKEAIPAGSEMPVTVAAKAAKCALVTHAGEGRAHTTDTVRYKTNPPSSGNHNAIPANDGAYSKAPSIGHLVHPLEHGRVVIWFKPTAPPLVRGQLKALLDESPDRLILTPNQTGMPYEVAASAWTVDSDHGGAFRELGHVLGCQATGAATLNAVRAFVRAYRGKGPEQGP